MWSSDLRSPYLLITLSPSDCNSKVTVPETRCLQYYVVCGEVDLSMIFGECLWALPVFYASHIHFVIDLKLFSRNKVPHQTPGSSSWRTNHLHPWVLNSQMFKTFRTSEINKSTMEITCIEDQKDASHREFIRRTPGPVRIIFSCTLTRAIKRNYWKARIIKQHYLYYIFLLCYKK